jgi:hypothetical protein
MAEEAAAAETALKIIDWEEAMTQVGGDEEFLNEVLQDLLTGEWDGHNCGWGNGIEWDDSNGRRPAQFFYFLNIYFCVISHSYLLMVLWP